MNKKSIGALLLSAALLVGASGATFAYFTDTAQANKQTITLGNVDVEFVPNSGSQWRIIDRASAGLSALQSLATLDFATAWELGWTQNMNEINTSDSNQIYYLAPGDVIAKSFTLKNTGKLDAKIKLALENIKVINKAGETVSKTPVEKGSYLFKAYEVNADGDRGAEIELDFETDNNGQGNFVLDAASGEEVVIYVGAALDEGIANDLMDSKVEFNVRADATQWNNPGWNQ